MALVESVLTLHQRGWSIRRIARELGVNRDTVARHLRQARNAAKPANAPSGSGPPQDSSKPANAPPGSEATAAQSKPANAPPRPQQQSATSRRAPPGPGQRL